MLTLQGYTLYTFFNKHAYRKEGLHPTWYINFYSWYKCEIMMIHDIIDYVTWLTRLQTRNHQSISFVKETYFEKFQGHRGHSISLSGKTKNILNFKNILHFKTTSSWSVKLAKFQMSQLLIPRICRVWFWTKNIPKELNTISGSGDMK